MDSLHLTIVMASSFTDRVSEVNYEVRPIAYNIFTSD